MASPKKYKLWLERLQEINPEAVTFDGFETCVVGICERFGMSPVFAYDYNACVKKLVKDGMTYDEAIEYFEFNTIGCWAGEGTPVFVHLDVNEFP